MSGQKPREIAAHILSRRSRNEFVEHLLDRVTAQASLSALDRSLCQELVYGVVRWQATLDWLIAARTDGRPQKPGLQDLLRLGLYQIFWLDRIPNHAAVHETVELAKQRGFGRQAGFINALLRGCIRDGEALRARLQELKTTQPHLGYSHPEWLVERWRRQFGAAETLKLLAWNNTPPKTYARINTLKTTPEALLPRWREEGVDYDFVRAPWLEENLVFELKSHPRLTALPSFQAGEFYVQDPSTLVAVRELEPRPGERVLDLCAAPGGKLTYAAQVVGNQGRLVAHEVDPDRAKLVVENCARLGVTCVQAASAELLNPLLGARYDRILVDAPCSNTGVLRRRVELRWRLRPEEIARLSNTQLELLNQAAGLLRPGGTLVYSTCSLESEENGGVIQRFLDNRPGFQCARECTLHPWVEGFDGAYVAVIKQA